MALPLTLPTGPHAPIGWINGEPVWPARGGRKNGMEFVVDSLDGDEPDEFDDDEPDDDKRDDDQRDRRGGQARKGKARRPAADDSDDDDDEADDEDDEAEEADQADDADADADEAWEPPTKEQWHKIEAALRRNNGENRKMRLTKKVMTRLGINDEQEFSDFLLDRGIDPETGNRLVDLGEDAGTGEQGDDDNGETRGGERRSKEQVVLERRRAEERGATRTEERYRPALVQFAAAAALAEADYSGKDMAMALRLFDMGDIDVEFDDNGDPVVYGLDDQVEKIKKEFPQLFRRKVADTAADGTGTPPRRRNGRTSNGGTGARSIDGGDRGRAAPAPKGWLAQLDKRITGGR